MQMTSEGGDAEAHKLEGNAFLKAGKLKEAIASYTKAIEADATVAAYWGNRCQTLLRTGDIEGALRDAEESARLKPEWSKAHYRRALALSKLKRAKAAIEACDVGLRNTTDEAETKEFNTLREKMIAEASMEDVRSQLAGSWYGKVSKELGGYEQEFCFNAGDDFKCTVESTEGPGKWALQKVESTTPGGGVRGSLSVTPEGAPYPTPYLFRIDENNKDVLHLCCPMVYSLEAPRTFDGPGYVAMRRGTRAEHGANPLQALSEGEQVVHYLNAIADALEENIPGNEGAGGKVAEALAEEDPGTVHAHKLMGQESLEDKSRKMAHENKLQALRLKYPSGIADTAEKLIKGELEAEDAYPEQAKELGKLMRRMGRSSAKQVDVQAPPP